MTKCSHTVAEQSRAIEHDDVWCPLCLRSQLAARDTELAIAGDRETNEYWRAEDYRRKYEAACAELEDAREWRTMVENYGYMSEAQRALCEALEMREHKHTADGIARVAISNLATQKQAEERVAGLEKLLERSYDAINVDAETVLAADIRAALASQPADERGEERSK